MKTIWIDLDNSPHVPFFVPIKRELEKAGYRVVVTARDCFQVCGLADLLGVPYMQVGRHYGKNMGMKVVGTVFRAMQLMAAVKHEHAVISASHGSRAGIMASKLLGIPSVVIADYEFSYFMPLFLPYMVIVPEVIPTDEYAKKVPKVATYPGIKEDVYVPDFKPSADLLPSLGLSEKDIVVTIRPPATEAHYHNPESEILFAAVIDYLSSNPDVRMVILPRNEVKQTAWIMSKWADLVKSRRIMIPEHVVNGLDLMWYSDLVISGGGTMNREAAALGVPVYSIFRGKIGAVDNYLSQEGRLTLLTSAEDLRDKVVIQRRNKGNRFIAEDRSALSAIVNSLIQCAEATNL